MKSRIWLYVGVTILILMLSLTLGERTAFAQLGCIDACLEDLADCTNRTGGSQDCEDNYDSCVEGCLPTA